MQNSELTETIIGCAYKVYNTLGFGFLESVYEKAMRIEIGKAGLSADAQSPIDEMYEKHTLGEFKADILVENKVIIELKSISSLNKSHEVRLVNYLTVKGIDTGLLINSGEKRVDIKRKVRELATDVVSKKQPSC